jgi:phosphatidylglycerophosphatase A
LKRVVWENVKGPRALSATLVATALGAGLIPLAPGTWGTIVAVPLAWVSNEWELAARLAFWIALLVAGTWAAATFDEVMRSGDNQSIVIDEVVGFGITAWTAGQDARTLAVAFVVFRIFDILKPFPIRQIDRWSKKKAHSWSLAAAKQDGRGQNKLSRYWGGFGVMADDVMAGFFGLAVIALLQWFELLAPA